MEINKRELLTIRSCLNRDIKHKKDLLIATEDVETIKLLYRLIDDRKKLIYKIELELFG